MNLVLPLTDLEEAKLLAKAQAEGTTPEQIVRQAIQPVLDSVPEEIFPGRKPRKSSRGLLAHLGPAPSAEDIDEVRKEMFANFGRDDL
jgi:hypothetical protein